MLIRGKRPQVIGAAQNLQDGKVVELVEERDGDSEQRQDYHVVLRNSPPSSSSPTSRNACA